MLAHRCDPYDPADGAALLTVRDMVNATVRHLITLLEHLDLGRVAARYYWKYLDLERRPAWLSTPYYYLW
jgi:hypothetical protein